MLATVYVGELVSSEWRGAFGSALGFSMSLGLQVPNHYVGLGLGFGLGRGPDFFTYLVKARAQAQFY
jgi:hypothetical protein